MPTYILTAKAGFDAPLTLASEDEHHLVRVMRASIGASVSVTDNRGQIGEAIITNLRPLELKLEKVELGPTPLPIHLVLSLIEPKAMDLAVRQLTELNVASVSFALTARCQKKDLPVSTIERFHAVARAAQIQCGRCVPLILGELKSLKAWVDEAAGLGVFASLRFPVSDALKPSVEKSARSLFAFVGPEGGFTREEETLLAESGLKPISLGATILRAETAAVVLAGVISCLFDSLKQ